jgi:WD40 repeat protein
MPKYSHSRGQDDLLRLIRLSLFGFLVSATSTSLFGQTRVPVTLRLQRGHAGGIFGVAFSADGRYVLTAGGDNSAILWDAAAGAELRRFEGHLKPVVSVAMSPDGRYVLTGSEDFTARIWDAATGAAVREFKGHANVVKSVAFSRDGRFVLTGSLDRTARLWHADTAAEVLRFEGHSGSVLCVRFSPDGKSVLTGSTDKTARLWDVRNGVELLRFEGHSGRVNQAEFSPDGKDVLTASEDQTARIWNAATAKQSKILTGHSRLVYSAVYSPDGKYVATGSLDKTVRIWAAATATELRHFGTPSDLTMQTQTQAVVFSPDGRFVLAGELDRVARLWDVATGAERVRYQGYSIDARDASFSSDGQHILTGDAKVSCLWETASGTEARRFTGSNSLASIFSPDGFSVIQGHPSDRIRVWDVKSGAEFPGFDADTRMTSSLAISPDGRSLLAGNLDNTARLIAMTVSGRELRRFAGHSGPVDAVAFSPDGQSLLTGSWDKTARLWNANTGTELQRFEGHTGAVAAVAFSPDGRRVLTGSADNEARLWDASTGALIRKLVGHLGYVTAVSFSADGQSILTSSWDRTARIWATDTGKEIMRFTGHTGIVSAAKFSHDGKYVLTGSVDGTARLWDASNGHWLAALVSFRDGGWAVVDPEGRYDASDPDNAPGLFWLATGDHIVELNQLKDRFYVKGLLARILARSYLTPVARFNEVYLPPEVKILSVNTRSAELLATSRGGGFGDVVVLVNGREVPQVGPPRRFDPLEKEVRVTVDLSSATLEPSGQNLFQATVKNLENTISSRYMPRGVFASAPRQKRPPRLFALIVGVSEYPVAKDLRALSWSAKDASDMKLAIEIAANKLFLDGVEVKVLASQTAEQPTKKNIMSYLEGLTGRVYPEDVLFVYLAGHGTAAKTPDGSDAYYFLTADSRSANVTDSSIAQDAISSVEIKRFLIRKDMPLKQVLILDTCSAGAFANQFTTISGPRAVSAEETRVIELLKDRIGMHILMGSAADGLSYEASQFAQGLLTHALLLGMQTEELGPGGSIEILRWFEYAEKTVAQIAKEGGVIQQPAISSPRGQSFPIGVLSTAQDRARIPLSEARPILLPPVVLGPDDFDDLQVGRALNRALIAVSKPVPRAGTFVAPKLVYLERAADNVDELPRMIKPYVRYLNHNGKLVAVVRLRTMKKVVASTEVSGADSDVPALAVKIVEWIAATALGQK